MSDIYGTEPWDEQDKEYLKRQIEKHINESDGKIPVQQLSKEDFDKWKGVNIQGYCTVPRQPEQNTLALYIIDPDQKVSKRFTVTKAMAELMLGRHMAVVYGTSDRFGHQVKMKIQWEVEKRE